MKPNPTPNAPVQAFATTLPAGVPTDIQWMPPGAHKIAASRAGKPIELTIHVTAKTAETMQKQLEEVRALAASGQEDLPYFDFNHDDKEASGHPTEFYWAGDDAKTGGVRAKLEWTEPGKAALTGKAYRRFSPSFFPNAGGEVTGAPLNMGGLVNRAAFKTITPIWSRESGGQGSKTPSQKKVPMDETETQLAETRAALAESQKQLAQVNAKLAEAKTGEVVKAKDAEIAELKGKIVSFENAQKEQIKVDAKAAVAAAVAAGRIPPQDSELQGHYEALYVANPTAGKAILAKLPVTAPGGAVIPPGTTTERKAAPTGEHEFVVKAKEYAATNKTGFVEATQAVAGANPDLYDKYMESLTPKA